MSEIEVYTLMSAEDTYDLTLIATMEMLIQKLRKRQGCKRRLYRIEQINTALMTYERMYVGCIPEEYAHKAKSFDDAINKALHDLK